MAKNEKNKFKHPKNIVNNFDINWFIFNAEISSTNTKNMNNPNNDKTEK